MLLGGSEFVMADTPNIQYNEDCYTELTFDSRQLRNVDLNDQANCNIHLNSQSVNRHLTNSDLNQQINQQINRQINQQINQQSNQQSNQQINQQSNQQSNHQSNAQFDNQHHPNHHNLVMDQFNNFTCNTLIPNLSDHHGLTNQQLFNPNLSDQNKTSELTNLITGQIKIKKENAINLSNDSSVNSINNINIPINCDSSEQINQNAKVLLVNHSSTGNNLSNPLPNLPINFNDLLLNDYQLNSNQLNQQNQLVNVQNDSCSSKQTNLEQSNKINSNNELSPIDMEDQERIKLERKRMRNRFVFLN